MTKTRDDLAQATLEEIQRAGVDEAPSAEDRQTVLDRMDTVFADLLARNIILQPIGDEIQDEQFDHLACILGERVAPRFGLGSDVSIKANAEAGREALRTIARINRGTRRTLSTDSALRPRRFGSYVRISN